MENNEKWTTLRISEGVQYRFNFIKQRDKFKNQDEFTNILLDLYEISKKKIKKVKVTDDKKEIKENTKDLNILSN